MILLANFIRAVAQVFDIGLTFFMWVFIAHAVLSWVSPDPFNPIARFINQVTEPLLHQIRRRIPFAFGGIDFSPMIVLLVIFFLKIFIVDSLFMFSNNLINQGVISQMR
jgi:YggT family protein